MKKLLLVTLLLSSMFSYGQISEMLVDTNKVWSNLFQTAPGGPPPHLCTTTFVRFSNDTLMASNHYKKVWATTDSMQLNYSAVGFIREESSHKVYFRSIQDTTDRLLYDFGAIVGDTIVVPGPTTLVVDSVESVFIHDRNVKRMVLSANGCSGEQWIEGIGSLNGVLDPGTECIVGTRHDLLCCYKNDTLHYSNPDFGACYYSVGITTFETHRINVSISPNPVSSTSTLTIEGARSDQFTLQILDVRGQVIKAIPVKNQQVSIHNRDFAPGIYFYRLITPEKETATGKFIVE
jgi:hypothetical protein